MNNPTPIALLCLALALACPLAQAEKADRDKPMNVEAETGVYDGVNKTGTFAGRVVLTKGSILVRGDKIDTREDPEGYQYATITGSAEVRAFYRQKQDGADEYLEGEAVGIEYNGRTDTIRFLQKAELRRLRGASLADEITGNVLTYENLADRVTVDGTVRNPNGTAGGRVRMMLTPKPAASAPPTPAGQPAPALRSSTTLGGNAK